LNKQKKMMHSHTEFKSCAPSFFPHPFSSFVSYQRLALKTPDRRTTPHLVRGAQPPQQVERQVVQVEQSAEWAAVPLALAVASLASVAAAEQPAKAAELPAKAAEPMALAVRWWKQVAPVELKESGALMAPEALLPSSSSIW
jgi:hypothetical protein